MNAVVFRLSSSAGTGYNYWVKKNPKIVLKLRKYDPVLRRHVLFIQKKK